MKKNMKKLLLVMVAVMAMGLISGCSLFKFDAKGYVQALLDNSYKNDSTAFVEMEIGTAEQAAELYEQGIDAEVDAMVTSSGINLSEDMKEAYREVFRDILGSVKYTVESDEKQEDGNYIVTISYEQMNVFGPAMDAYTESIETMAEELTEEEVANMTEEDMYDMLLEELKVCLTESLANVTYDEPQTVTVRVERNENVFAPNEEDIAKVEEVLFDTEELE